MREVCPHYEGKLSCGHRAALMLPQSASIGFLYIAIVHTKAYTLEGVVLTFCYVLESWQLLRFRKA